MSNDKVEIKPFLKWAGGKSQLLPAIESVLPTQIKETKTIDKYFEPFVGGGALFFYLLASDYDVKKAYISDINEDLILTYKIIRDEPEKLIEKLEKLESKFNSSDFESRKDMYYRKRDYFNCLKDNLDYGGKFSKKHILQAAYLIFMNKTCFNGIYRVNSKGYFNVPMGRYKKPSIYDKQNILNISSHIQDVEIYNCSYEVFEKDISTNSFVYLDPPYRPITETSFTSYTKSNFNDDDQRRLAIFYKKISKKGAYVMLSNSDPLNRDKKDKFFDNLYSDFEIDRVFAKRYINCDGANRGPITEILVRNYHVSDSKKLKDYFVLK